MKTHFCSDLPKKDQTDRTWELNVLPHIYLYGGDIASCLGIGWLFWRLEFWCGDWQTYLKDEL